MLSNQDVCFNAHQRYLRVHNDGVLAECVARIAGLRMSSTVLCAVVVISFTITFRSEEIGCHKPLCHVDSRVHDKSTQSSAHV